MLLEPTVKSPWGGSSGVHEVPDGDHRLQSIWCRDQVSGCLLHTGDHFGSLCDHHDSHRIGSSKLRDPLHGTLHSIWAHEINTQPFQLWGLQATYSQQGIPSWCTCQVHVEMDGSHASATILGWCQHHVCLWRTCTAGEQCDAFLLYRINTMLNPHSLFIHLYEVMDHTPWGCYYRYCTHSVESKAYQDSHQNIIIGLDLLWNWSQNCYLVEATEELKFMCNHGGSLDMIPFPPLVWGPKATNEGLFYRTNGMHPWVKPTLENAPHITNTMLEALAHHDKRQLETRNC